MTNAQYNATLTIFFVSYSVFEPATNVLLKRLRPSIFIPLIMMAWVSETVLTPYYPSNQFQGICMTFMGFVKNYHGLMAVRWFLGLSEAGLFPGVGYFLSCWYKRSEFGVRMAIFFSAAALAGSFGGLLAAAIAKMDGVAGKPGWSWISFWKAFLRSSLVLPRFGVSMTSLIRRGSCRISIASAFLGDSLPISSRVLNMRSLRWSTFGRV
jgi:Sugar phosphate permease